MKVMFLKSRPLFLCLLLALPARVAWAHFQTCAPSPNYTIPYGMCKSDPETGVCNDRLMCGWKTFPRGVSHCVGNDWALAPPALTLLWSCLTFALKPTVSKSPLSAAPTVRRNYASATLAGRLREKASRKLPHVAYTTIACLTNAAPVESNPAQFAPDQTVGN